MKIKKETVEFVKGEEFPTSDIVVLPVTPKPKGKRGRPKGSKNKPKEVA